MDDTGTAAETQGATDDEDVELDDEVIGDDDGDKGDADGDDEADVTTESEDVNV